MNEIATKTDLYFRPRYRKSPFFEATRALAGHTGPRGTESHDR